MSVFGVISIRRGMPIHKMALLRPATQDSEQGMTVLYKVVSQHATRSPGQRHFMTKRVGRRDVLMSTRCFATQRMGDLMLAGWLF